MHFNHPNSLHRYPRKDGSLSDEYSDFPPIRERKSSPDPPIASVASLSCHHSLAVQRSEPRSSSEVQSPPPRNKGLGQKNILNAIRVKRAPKFLSKRALEVEVADEHPRKRQHRTLEADMHWLKGEFADIKTRITEIGEQASATQNSLLTLEPLPSPSVATGLVSFSGFALLGCPELVPKSRAVDLIAQLYIGSPTIDFLSSLYGYLRYFNNDGIVFSHGPSKLYLIQGTIAQVPSNGSNLPYLPPDCDFVGDIHSIIQLGSAPQDGIEPQIDINQPITLHISGLVLNSNADKGTFTVNVNVNVSSYKNAKDGGGNALQPPAPFVCIISNSLNNGTQGKLAMPSNRSIVSVVGTLTNVTFIDGNRHHGIECFHLTVQQIVSLHSYTRHGTTPSSNPVSAKKVLWARK